MAREVGYGEKIGVNEDALETLERYTMKLKRKEMLNEEEVRTLIDICDTAYEGMSKASGEEYHRLAEIYRTAEEVITKVGEMAKEMAGEPKEITVEKGKLMELHSNQVIDDLREVLEDIEAEEVEDILCVYRREDGRILLVVPEPYGNKAQEEVQGKVTLEDWKKFLEEAKSGIYRYERERDKLSVVLKIFTLGADTPNLKFSRCRLS